jgi:glycosyltransferase involved in cell wall biosynthesis
MKKVLIITYAFPPSNNVAIHRILRFGKWLPKYGWEPVVLTPDYTLSERIDTDNIKFVKKYFKRVYRVSSKLESTLVNIADKKNRSIVARFMRGYILRRFVPELSYLWKREAIKKGLEIIHNENIDAIWATIGPPVSGIIGAELERITSTPLLVDYRDPWTLNPYKNYKKKNLKNNIKLEKTMLESASAVITTSKYIKELTVNNNYYNEERTYVITNGCDDELQWMNEDISSSVLDKNKINITYAGTFYHDRQPYSFIDGLKLFLNENPEYNGLIRFNIIGNLDYNRNIYNYCRKFNLEGLLFEEGLLPYRIAMHYLKKSDILLLVNGSDLESRIFVPGKLFDYLITKKPILFIGNGQAGEILSKLRMGEQVAHNKEAIKNALKKMILNKFDSARYLSNDYRAENIVQELCNIFESISSSNVN